MDSAFNPLSNTTPKQEKTDIQDEAAPDLSLTSSGLLAKHTANIARLASSFGIALEPTPKVSTAKKESPIQFDKGEFTSKLSQMV